MEKACAHREKNNFNQTGVDVITPSVSVAFTLDLRCVLDMLSVKFVSDWAAGWTYVRHMRAVGGCLRVCKKKEKAEGSAAAQCVDTRR